MAVMSPSDDLVQIGSVLDGRYRIDAVLGKGGMGCVYRAEHTGIGRAVAIKVLHADLGRNREVVMRFRREALASGRLDHPNIVGVSDFGVLDEGGCFLVMEALEGESLGARLDRDGSLAWGEALQILRGVLAGLQHAHNRGVVHRDIKPDNIFLALKDGEPVVKILDFGIAKLYADSGDDPATTRAGLTIGTPAYLSPEQALGGEITPASDLYSATVVLFEMLTGHTPFEGADPVAMLMAHAVKPPPTLHDVAPAVELPPKLEELVQRGLAKLAIDRIGSAGEYLVAIGGLLGEPPPAQGASQPLFAVPAVRSASSMTPPPAVRTPLAFEPTLVHAQTPTTLISDPARPVALPGLEPTPMSRRYWRVGGGVLAGAILLSIIASAVTRSGAPPVSTAKPAPPSTAPSTAPSTPMPAPTPPPAPAVAVTSPPSPTTGSATPPPVSPHPGASSDDGTSEHDAAFRAAIIELTRGRTCRERASAIKKLVALDDPRAIPELKKARHWWHERYFGLSADDWNACLTRAADAAVASLTPPK